MISAWHLLWIVPVIMLFSVMAYACAVAAGDRDRMYFEDKEENDNEQRNDMEESEK